MKTADAPLMSPVPGVAVWQWTPSDLVGLPTVTVDRVVCSELLEIARVYAGTALVRISGRMTPKDRDD